MHRSFIQQPWWSRVAPSLAIGSTVRWLRRTFGSEIEEAVRFYDRQIESWLKTNVAQIVELYETQASAFREQLRRMTSESPEPSGIECQGNLEADLRRLRQAKSERDGQVMPSGATHEPRAAKTESGSG